VSKAFTREETVDQPLVVAARPPLPAGVPNYVTARGLALLRAEAAALEEERARLASARDVEAPRLTALDERLAALAARIGSAVVLELPSPPAAEVRFGATVTVRGEAEDVRSYTLVGVDEANAAEGRISFVAPLARALLGRRAGDVVELRTGRGEESLVIVAVAYAPSRADQSPSG